MFPKRFISSYNKTETSIAGVGGGGEGEGLPYKRLMGMCRWMGSPCYDWIDYDRVAHFRIFWGRTVLHILG